MTDNTNPTTTTPLPPTSGGTATAVADDPAKAGTKTASDGIVIDKNKSAEQYMKEAQSKYIIPSLVREKFPDLVKFIYETESMNQEEREYWMQIMPIMTEEQIVKFRNILVNEKDQLAKLDNDYEREMSRINQKPVKEIDEKEMKERIDTIKKAEAQSQEQEQSKEDQLLKQLNEI